MRTIRRGERARVLVGVFVASVAIVPGCTAGPEATTTEVLAPSVAVQPVASTIPEVDRSRVMLVDVRSGSVTPMPPALTAFDEASDYRRSPDGSRFVFGAAVEDGSTRQLFLGSVDGSRVRQLTDEPLAATGGRWSPDGSKIVFLGGGFLTSRLKRIDVTTGDVERVHGVPRGVWEPSFSPDGRSILFSMATATPRGGWRVDLWTVPVGGGIRTRLIRHGGYAAYSPDGSTIAYHRTQPQPSAFCGKCWWIEGGLSIAAADGREELGMSHGGMIAPPQAHLMSGARWSPDGSMVMHTELVAITGRAEIVVRDVRDGETIRIGRGVWPTWFDDRTLIVPDLGGSS
jgi:dipeptidyl aminopeptidase/acylaminoacyl peptidase